MAGLVSLLKVPLKPIIYLILQIMQMVMQFRRR